MVQHEKSTRGCYECRLSGTVGGSASGSPDYLSCAVQGATHFVMSIRVIPFIFGRAPVLLTICGAAVSLTGCLFGTGEPPMPVEMTIQGENTAEGLSLEFRDCLQSKEPQLQVWILDISKKDSGGNWHVVCQVWRESVAMAGHRTAWVVGSRLPGYRVSPACSETLTTGNYRVSVLANRNGSELATADGYGLFEVRSDGTVTWLLTEGC